MQHALQLLPLLVHFRRLELSSITCCKTATRYNRLRAYLRFTHDCNYATDNFAASGLQMLS